MILFFFFNDTATTEIYTLSLHDALPISAERRDQRHDRNRERQGAAHRRAERLHDRWRGPDRCGDKPGQLDRKSTRLNSSHANISYAVFCLKKKKTKSHTTSMQ